MAYCIWSVCSTVQYNIVLSLVQSSAVQQHQHLRVSHTMKNRTIPWLPIVCVISLIKVPCSKYSTYSNNSTVRTPETNARDYISSRDDPPSASSQPIEPNCCSPPQSSFRPRSPSHTTTITTITTRSGKFVVWGAV